LIAQVLNKRGLGETAIGLNAAMYALGVLAVALWLPRLAGRFGIREVMGIALFAVSVVLPAFPLSPWIFLWFPLRFALGIASEAVFVTSEAWVNQLSDDRSRARTIAVYTAALSLGFALGPMILSAVGSAGTRPYLIGAGLALVALSMILVPGIRVPRFDDAPSEGSLWSIARLAPVALAATALNSSLETAGLTFLPIYAMRLGWSETNANLLISTLLIGAITLQLPIGWLGDRFDRRKLVQTLAVLAASGALIWPLAFEVAWLAYPLAFVWGGVFVGIYTLMVTIIGSRFAGGDLLGIYAVMSVAWGFGAMLGPTMAGAAMEALRHGLSWFAGVVCAAFALFAWRSRQLS
jgi:MFS family permease